jgi:hypothetical protein
MTTVKWTGGVAEAAECLLCMCKALSSNPNPNKKKERRNYQKCPNNFMQP